MEEFICYCEVKIYDGSHFQTSKLTIPIKAASSSDAMYIVKQVLETEFMKRQDFKLYFISFISVKSNVLYKPFFYVT